MKKYQPKLIATYKKLWELSNSIHQKDCYIRSMEGMIKNPKFLNNQNLSLIQEAYLFKEFEESLWDYLNNIINEATLYTA